MSRTINGSLSLNIANIESNLIPSVSNNYSIGSSAYKWKDFYLNGVGYLSTLNNGGNLTLPNATDTLVGQSTIASLSNKTLLNPTINTPTIVNNGYAITLPNLGDTLVGRNTIDTLTNKTLSSAVLSGTTNLSSVTASQALVTDSSKNLSSISYTSQPTVSTIASRDSSGNSSFNQISVNNTILNGPSGSIITVYLPSSGDTIVGRATTDTLTNKTFSSGCSSSGLPIFTTNATGNLTTTPYTLTATQLLGGIVQLGDSGSNGSLTLPTALSVISSFSNPFIGLSFSMLIQNGSIRTWTINAGTGWTVNLSTSSVSPTTSKFVVCVITSVSGNTMSIYG